MILRRIGCIAIVVVAAALAGCGGGGSNENAADTTESADSSVIRFVFSPDPVWDYIKDSGILEEMGAESGINIVQLETWDEYGLFAGHHADIVSTGSYETPLMDAQGIETVTFGQYNMSKDLMVTSNPKWKTAKDLPKGCKIAVEAVTGNATIWKALLKKIDNRDLSEGGDDLKMATADYQIMPTLVEKGDVCASFSDPTQITKPLREGKVFPMYDGKSASQLYGEYIVPGHAGVNSNNFVAHKAWFDSHPKEVAFFLKVWQKGLDAWHKDAGSIIDSNPEDFGIQSDADAAFIKDYIKNTFDFFVDSVYLTPEWITGEQRIFDLIKENGELPKGAEYNAYAVVNPTSGVIEQTIAGDKVTDYGAE